MTDKIDPRHCRECRTITPHFIESGREFCTVCLAGRIFTRGPNGYRFTDETHGLMPAPAVAPRGELVGAEALAEFARAVGPRLDRRATAAPPEEPGAVAQRLYDLHAAQGNRMFLAAYLGPVENAALLLGSSLAAARAVGLCTPPRGDRWGEDVAEIAGYCGVDEAVLDDVLRRLLLGAG